MPSACVVTGYGPPDVLEWEDVPMPEPSATEIRIKVRVSGVGPKNGVPMRAQCTPPSVDLYRPEPRPS